MIKSPAEIKQRVIQAALAVNKCVAEFGEGNGLGRVSGLEHCLEIFQELSAACYELERWQDDVYLMRQKLQTISVCARNTSFPFSAQTVETETKILLEMLDRWEGAG